jgi:hypothetical protein
MFARSQLEKLADELTISLSRASITNSNRRYNEHWALEQLCRRQWLRLRDEPRCKMRLDFDGRVEVSAERQPWTKGLPIIEWMTAIRAHYPNGYELQPLEPMKVPPQPLPKPSAPPVPPLPEQYREQMMIAALQQQTAQRLAASPIAKSIEAGIAVQQQGQELQRRDQAFRVFGSVGSLDTYTFQNNTAVNPVRK